MKGRLRDDNERYLHFDITGEYALEDGRRLLERLFERCEEAGADRLLVNITRKTGAIPDVDRFFLGQLIAELNCRHGVKLAVIGKSEQINRFSETVALNRGAQLFVTDSEKDAIDWLVK